MAKQLSISTIYRNYQLIIESASEEAHKRNLKYAGYGKWKDASGKTVAKSVKDASGQTHLEDLNAMPGTPQKLAATKPESMAYKKPESPVQQKVLAPNTRHTDPYYTKDVDNHNVPKHESDVSLEDAKFDKPLDINKMKQSSFNFAGAKRIGEQAGTNPGGLFEIDGHKYYVKVYDKAEQGIVEDYANEVYTSLGVPVAHSQVVKTGEGKVAYLSKIRTSADDHDLVPLGQLPKGAVTTQMARKFLDGFAADVLLANWDVMGFDNDNVLVDPSQGTMIRIDNGSSLLYRAQGTKKEKDNLMRLSEFDGFANHHVNRHYAEMFKTAGYRSPLDMGVHLLEQIWTLKSKQNAHPFNASFVSRPEWGNRWEVRQLMNHRLTLLKNKIPEIKDHIVKGIFDNVPNMADMLGDKYNISTIKTPGEQVIPHIFEADTQSTGHPRWIHPADRAQDTFAMGVLSAQNQVQNFRTKLSPEVNKQLTRFQEIWQAEAQFDNPAEGEEMRKFFDNTINGINSPNAEKAEIEVLEGGHVYRGMAIQSTNFAEFIANFEVGKDMKLSTAGYTANKATAVDFTGVAPDEVSVLLKVRPNQGSKMAGLHLSHSSDNIMGGDGTSAPERFNRLVYDDEEQYVKDREEWFAQHPNAHEDLDEESNLDHEVEIVRPSNARLKVAAINKHITASPGFGGGAQTTFFYEIELEDHGLDVLE